MTLIFKTPGGPSGAGCGPLTLAAFLFVLYLCLRQACSWGIPAASTKESCKTKHRKYRKVRTTSDRYALTSHLLSGLKLE